MSHELVWILTVSLTNDVVKGKLPNPSTISSFSVTQREYPVQATLDEVVSYNNGDSYCGSRVINARGRQTSKSPHSKENGSDSRYRRTHLECSNTILEGNSEGLQRSQQLYLTILDFFFPLR